MNHSVNKLIYGLKDMDKDIRKTLSEAVTILFNSSEKENHLGTILNRLGFDWRWYIQHYISDCTYHSAVHR